MEWKKDPVSVEDVRRLNELFGVDYITASLLARRGITKANQIEYFLEDDLSHLHNPFLFEEMEMFVERILAAREESEKIRIFGDRDVDGITATVLLNKELGLLGIETTWHLPEGDEPYGLTKESVQKAWDEGVTLIITVDCGISNHEEVEYARSLGMDVLITDHHIGGELIPAAVAVINPKLPGCGYPFAHLAGCGVAAKCIWALRFSMTDLYQEELILLHALPGNTEPGKETVIIEAARVKNLIVEDRIREEVIPGLLRVDQSRLVDFLNRNIPIFAFDIATEKTLLRKAFGKSAEIHLVDLEPLFAKVLPQSTDRSLFSMMQSSRSIRYLPDPTELDILISLFIDYTYVTHPSISDDYEKLLDLVAIGTIADLMPMVDENRLLVRHGLKMIASMSRKSLQPLLMIQNLSGKVISTTDVGWQLTPVINASGRMGKPQVAVNMLLAEDEEEIKELTNELIAMNRERQRQGEEYWDMLTPKAARSHSDHGGKFLFIEEPSINRGMTGVLASRFLKKYNTPVLVVAHLDGDRVTGSMRSPLDFDVRAFLNRFNDLFIDFGGHKCAGGFSMDKQNLVEFRRRMLKEIDIMEEASENEEIIRIDVELPPEYMNPKLISLVEAFEPYGEHNPPLQFYIRKARIDDIQILNRSKSSGPNHVKLQLQYGNFRWPAVYWGGSNVIQEGYKAKDEVDVVFRLGRNYYRNNESLQLTVIALRKSKRNIDEIMVR